MTILNQGNNEFSILDVDFNQMWWMDERRDEEINLAHIPWELKFYRWVNSINSAIKVTHKLAASVGHSFCSTKQPYWYDGEVVQRKIHYSFTNP